MYFCNCLCSVPAYIVKVNEMRFKNQTFNSRQLRQWTAEVISAKRSFTEMRVEGGRRKEKSGCEPSLPSNGQDSQQTILTMGNRHTSIYKGQRIISGFRTWRMIWPYKKGYWTELGILWRNTALGVQSPEGRCQDSDLRPWFPYSLLVTVIWIRWWHSGGQMCGYTSETHSTSQREYHIWDKYSSTVSILELKGTLATCWSPHIQIQ